MTYILTALASFLVGVIAGAYATWWFSAPAKDELQINHARPHR